MKRSSAMVRRASMARSRLAIDWRPQPSRSSRAAARAVLPEGLDMAAAQAVDVEGAAADEMLQPLDRLGLADQPAGAAPHRLARLADGEAVADRAMVGERVGLAAG